MKSKKHLGQHFLSAPGVIDTIVDAGNIQKTDTVLEIGPGKGALTRKLLQTGASAVAIEKDEDLIPNLEARFEEEIETGWLQLIHADILKVSLDNYGLQTGKFKLIANIPYNITGIILRTIIGGEVQPSTAVLVVQKEVAERIIARDGKESLLSLSVKAYGNPSYIRTIKPGSFVPPPRVDSAIIGIENISRELFKNIDERAFFELIHKGFAHKRKQLRKNLSISRAAFIACEIDPKSRAEDLALGDWKCLLAGN